MRTTYLAIAAATTMLIGVGTIASEASLLCNGIMQFCANVHPDSDGDVKTSNKRPSFNPNNPPPSFPPIPNLPPEIGQPWGGSAEISDVPITGPYDPRTRDEKGPNEPIKNLPPELSQPW